MRPVEKLLYTLGQAHGVLGYGAIPGADIPTALVQKYMPKAWPYAQGMASQFVRRASPIAMGASAIHMWETSGARQRFTDTMLNKPREGAHWDNTPKARFEARKSHGFFVRPKDRMVRNKPLPYGEAYVRQEASRFS